MKRKFLFLLFTEDACQLVHAFLYAEDLKKNWHAVQMIIEGAATRKVRELGEGDADFLALFQRVKKLGLIAGACKTASQGCGKTGSSSATTEWMKTTGVPLLDTMEGHASIAGFIDEGYEVISF